MRFKWHNTNAENWYPLIILYSARQSLGLSETLFPNKSVELYSPKGPENVKITTSYRYTGRLFKAATRRNNSYCDI